MIRDSYEINAMARRIYLAKPENQPALWVEFASELTGAEMRALLSAHSVLESTKGPCPVCGNEETNTRGLWTCECPAQSAGGGL